MVVVEGGGGSGIEVKPKQRNDDYPLRILY